MLANAWVLGITYPQSIKWLGHFLTADNISAGTPDGGHGISGAAEVRAYPALRICYHKWLIDFLTSITTYDCKSPEHKEVRTFFDGG